MKTKIEYEASDIDLSDGDHTGDPVHDFLAGLMIMAALKVVTFRDGGDPQLMLADSVAAMLNLAEADERVVIVRREP